VTDAEREPEARPQKATHAGRSALVLTASDRSAAGEREDSSGADVTRRLEQLGFTVERMVVPDEKGRISRALAADSACALFSPRMLT